MNLRSLMPFGGARSLARGGEADPFWAFHRDMNRLFDDFTRGFGTVPSAAGNGGSDPKLDIKETEKAFEIAAELPGVDEKDVEVTLADNVLTIKGEKRAEKEEKDKNYVVMERSYGAFERAIPLPVEVDESKVAATFIKGVLNVTLPKSKAAEAKTTKIEVKKAG